MPRGGSIPGRRPAVASGFALSREDNLGPICLRIGPHNSISNCQWSGSPKPLPQHLPRSFHAWSKLRANTCSKLSSVQSSYCGSERDNTPAAGTNTLAPHRAHQSSLCSKPAMNMEWPTSPLRWCAPGRSGKRKCTCWHPRLPQSFRPILITHLWKIGSFKQPSPTSIILAS